MVEKNLNNTTPYGKIRASHEGSLHSSTLTSLLNMRGHIATVPACSIGTLTDVLPYMNAMPQTQGTHPTPSQYTDTGHTPHPVTVYRHRAHTPPRHSIQTQGTHPTPSQYTDTGHTPHPVTVYRHRAHTPPRHSIQTQGTHPTPSQYTDTGHTPHPVTVYRHMAVLSLCFLLMLKVTLEYTTTYISLSWVRPNRKILPRPSKQTSERSTLC